MANLISLNLVSRNPATGEPVGEVQVAQEADIVVMVQRAHQAAKSWRQTSLLQRIDYFEQAAAVLAESAEEIGGLICAEMGRPQPVAIGEAQGIAQVLVHEAKEIAEALAPHSVEDDKVSSTFFYEPLGVCAAITPWNFPVNMAQWMVLPALMAGNTVVLKPSEETPLAVQKYVDILNQFLPEDVLQIVHGGKDIGRALVNADVQLIAFTGSRRAGQQILMDAAKDFKRIILELGGKDPLVVLEDADVQAAAKFAAQNSYFNSGQVCVSSERIYVHESVAAEFEKTLLDETAAINVIPGDGQNSDLGPMVAEFQREHVLRQLTDAVEQGAEVLSGEKEHPKGYVLPTVLKVDDSMDIMREETFGPVACVRPYSDLDEIMEKINDSIYGLGAVIFSQDIEKASAVARRIESGMIGINKGCRGAQGTPWIGAKQSGYNYHGGEAGHRQFAQIKIVSTPK